MIKLSRLKYRQLVLIAMVTIVVYNEWFSYLITASWWPPFPPKESKYGLNSVCILLVADAQIIGDEKEPFFPLGTVIRWDADRYMQQSFNLALAKIHPDVIIFLGDQMDEGSIATVDQFHHYADRLLTIFAVEPHIKTVFVVGDNDIGGEGRDFITPEKLKRFQDAFDNQDAVSYKFLQFVQVNQLSPRPSALTLPTMHPGDIRILLSHVPLLPFYTSYVEKEISSIQPHFIFSAHEHESVLFTHKRNTTIQPEINIIEDNYLHTFTLHTNDINEIVVPTCSYRMGKKKMGFGAAQIDPSGTIHYTVLWLPSRYPKLYAYMAVLFCCVMLLIKPCFITCKRICNLCTISNKNK